VADAPRDVLFNTAIANAVEGTGSTKAPVRELLTA
jgi:hypothetical protein